MELKAFSVLFLTNLFICLLILFICLLILFICLLILFIYFCSRDKYDRRSERSCDSPRTSHHRLHYGHRGGLTPAPSTASGPARSPSPNPGGPAGSNAGSRYKPSTQAISPPRDSFSDSGEGKHSYVGDLRDSLNRTKESRNNRYHRGYSSAKETSLKDPR